MDEIKAIACNYIQGTKVCRPGAKAFVLWTNPGNASDRITVYARSRGGRWVTKFEDARRLGNFRRVTLVPQFAPYHAVREHAYPMADSDEWLARMNTRAEHGSAPE